MEIVMANAEPLTVYVTFEGGPNDHFDQRRYVEHHLPLVMQAWQRYGLESLKAFFPPQSSAGTVSICECRFRDEAAFEAALASPQTAEVMGDVPTFTNLSPTRFRVTRL
jgi:uncharacterized protein (TIGR02118 family)